MGVQLPQRLAPLHFVEADALSYYKIQKYVDKLIASGARDKDTNNTNQTY